MFQTSPIHHDVAFRKTLFLCNYDYFRLFAIQTKISVLALLRHDLPNEHTISEVIGCAHDRRRRTDMITNGIWAKTIRTMIVMFFF